MRPYEVMVIFDADLDEETIRSAVERSVAAHRVEGRRDVATSTSGASAGSRTR